MIEHKPVLLKESIEGLNLQKGATVVDATLGGGGHSREILQIIGDRGQLIAIDQDQVAISCFKKELPSGAVNLVRDNFSNLENILGGMNVLAVSGILADLGYSSRQLEDGKYGMSFLKDAPLDMRLDEDGKLTAGKIVNGWSRQNLEKMIKEFGEEKFAKNIAREIEEIRKVGEIRGTKELAEIIKQAIPKKFQSGRIHPATKTFQALRIAVNQELANLEKFIPPAVAALKPGGRLAIISFHSLEDRIVKNMFRENARGCICPTGFPQCRCGQKPKIKIITKKPITPSPEEILGNPRARSAKLRICEKI